MKFFVTGAQGRVGKEVVRQLHEQGHKIVGYDIYEGERSFSNVDYVTGSIEDCDTITRLLKGVDVVIHLAAFMSWDRKEHDKVISCNVLGSQSVLEAAVRNDIERFVFASSGEVYPEVAPRYMPVDENHPLLPTSLYGESKKLGEDLVAFYSRVYGMATVIVRFPHTQSAQELLDPDSFFSGPRFFLQSKIRQMEGFGNIKVAKYLESLAGNKLQHILQRGEDGTSYCMHISDVRDTAAGVILAATHSHAIGKTYNLTTDNPVKFSEVLPLMSKITGCEVIEAFLPGAAVNYHTSNQQMKNDLGYIPKYSFERMLEEATYFWSKNK